MCPRLVPLARVNRWIVVAIPIDRREGVAPVALCVVSMARQEDEALVIGAEGRWFRAPGAARVDLSHRKPLCRILALLAERHVAGHRAGSSQEDLAKAGWPGERIMPSAASTRVRVGIASLRAFGLRGYLVRDPGGYALSAAVAVRIAAT